MKRYDLNDNLIQTSKVPLNYGPREKFLARLEGNPDLNRPIAIQLPRMSFEMTGMYYDPSRKMPNMNKITVDDGTGKKYQYAPVPYNIDFTLWIMVKNVMDGTYIVEQILPYFNPMWQATLNLNPDLNAKYDVPITLDNITHEDAYEGSFQERRAIIWTLNFTMKGWFFGPTFSANTGIVKNIDANINVPPNGISTANATANNTSPAFTINVTPGQDANGNAINTSSFLYTYGITGATGDFYVTEKIFAGSNTNNYAYVKTANSTYITSLDHSGNIAIGSTITGEYTGQSATVSSIGISPGPPVPWNSIYANSQWGFIIDLIENL